MYQMWKMCEILPDACTEIGINIEVSQIFL